MRNTSFAGISLWCLVVGYSFFCPLVVAVRVSMFDLRTLGPGCSEGASRRMQIHPICRTSQLRGGLSPPWLCQTGFVVLRWIMMTQGLSYAHVGSPQEFVCDSWMFEECSPPILVSRLLNRSGFGNAIGSIKTSASYDIQEITFLGGCLMWNSAAVWTLFIVSILMI